MSSNKRSVLADRDSALVKRNKQNDSEDPTSDVDNCSSDSELALVPCHSRLQFNNEFSPFSSGLVPAPLPLHPKSAPLDTRLMLVETGSVFWPLFKHLEAEGSGFKHNIIWLLDAFKKGQMHTLQLADTKEMDQFVSLYCCPYTFRILPCICVVEDTACKILWVSERLRRRGLATTFVDSLYITKPIDMLESSYPFWNAMNPLMERNRDLLEH